MVVVVPLSRILLSLLGVWGARPDAERWSTQATVGLRGRWDSASYIHTFIDLDYQTLCTYVSALFNTGNNSHVIVWH